jgi:hypothetical protein
MELCYSTVLSCCVVFWSCHWILLSVVRLCAVPLSRLRDRTLFGRCNRGIHPTMTIMPGVTRPLVGVACGREHASPWPWSYTLCDVLWFFVPKPSYACTLCDRCISSILRWQPHRYKSERWLSASAPWSWYPMGGLRTCIFYMSLSSDAPSIPWRARWKK